MQAASFTVLLVFPFPIASVKANFMNITAYTIFLEVIFHANCSLGEVGFVSRTI